MKRLVLVIVLFFVTPLLFSQNENSQNVIPDELLGSWVFNQKGEGQTPSQIMRWKFSKINSTEGETEFYWLFKRQEDKDFITVAVMVGSLQVKNDEFYSTIKKVGSMQKEPMVMEFYDTVKWYFPGDSLFEKTPKESSYHFEIKEDALILSTDYNKDGDFNDQGEIQQYTKEVNPL
jgi:hypothetical protein